MKLPLVRSLVALAAMVFAFSSRAETEATSVPQATAPSAIKVFFVIAMENHDAKEIYGDVTDAPYINNTLLPAYAHSSNFNDDLALSVPSEPHYIWMEAGTNKFSDHTFSTDSDASKSNSTSSTAHLATQIDNATTGISWKSYQEGITSTTGSCPITSSGQYAAKHDPFVFFQDISGKTPSKTNSVCASHHKDLSQLAADLDNHAVATYNFITPDLCHDMHGNSGCPSNTIASGDQWLAANLPAIINYVNANNGVIFVTWDEGDQTTQMPFIAIGPHVKAGYTSSASLNHSSLLKSVERILQVPILSTVTSASDLTDLFVSGYFP